MVKSIYEWLHLIYNDAQVEFDRSVKNPGRIFRLYGTVNRKGESTEDRPHRMSKCHIPDEWRQVTAQIVERTANAVEKAIQAKRPKKQTETRPCSHRRGNSRGDYASLDAPRGMV